MMFFKEGLGHLYNEHILNQNGPKGQNCVKIVKRAGYRQQFQYKLASLTTCLSPNFSKLRKSSMEIPKFISDAYVSKKYA